MSGPKVVRIVTREEILEICQGMLARVDAALAEWIRIGQRNDCVDNGAIEAARGRRDALAALIAVDRLIDLQKQAPLEEMFLREDLQSRLAKVAAEQAAARSRDRREREIAATMLRTLRERDASIDPNLEQRLKRGEAAAISEAFELLALSSEGSRASRDLADRLRDGSGIASFNQWLMDQPINSDPAIEKIELRIAELATTISDTVAANWRARLDEAASADQARRNLLLDGLGVETGRALSDARKQNAALMDLELVLAELGAAGIATDQYRANIEALTAAGLIERRTAALETLNQHRARTAALARREVVLKELSALGYEVTEGMTTSWSEEGRLVLKSATRPDYGVEVTTVGNNERMQMRAVAFDDGNVGSDPARDREAETIWCGDVSSLQDRLAEIGGGLVIEKARPVGATPLKRVASSSDRHRAATSSPLQTRTLD
jgi:hypothetical protein